MGTGVAAMVTGEGMSPLAGEAEEGANVDEGGTSERRWNSRTIVGDSSHSAFHTGWTRFLKK